MLGFAIISKKELQTLKLSEKSLLAQSEQLLRERNEVQLRYELAQKELERYRPIRGEKGKFISKK